MTKIKKTDNKASGGGVSFLGLLALAFIVLKLTGVIAWSWWLVLLPLWGPVALALSVVIISAAVVGIGAAVGSRKQ